MKKKSVNQKRIGWMVILLLLVLAVPMHAENPVEKDMAWFKQHDYLFTDEFFSGEQWLSLNYARKYQLVEDYYRANDIEFDVRHGLLTLDFMFNVDHGIYKQYSVYAILDKVVSEAIIEESPRMYSSSSGSQ